MEKTLLFPDDSGIFTNAVHRICNRHEHKYPHTLPSERISVLWRISGGDPVRQYETSRNKTLAQARGFYLFCADHIGGKQRGKSKEQFILSVTIL